MTNPTLELYRLRDELVSHAQSEYGWIGRATHDITATLRRQGKSEDRVDELVYRAEHELNIAITDIVVDSIQEVQELAIEYGIEDFAEHVDLRTTGGTFEIIVKNGQTDFSTTKEEMLPKLLQNGKTAKDGSIYRVVPLPEVREQKRRSLSSVDAMIARSEDIKKSRAERGKTLDAGRMARNLAGSLPKRKMTTEVVVPASGKDFKTASSKQNPSTQWVRPERDIDIASELMGINSRMQMRIESATQTIIHKHGG